VVILADRAVGISPRDITAQLGEFDRSRAVYGAQHVVDKHLTSGTPGRPTAGVGKMRARLEKSLRRVNFSGKDQNCQF
jgi:hypothetical protein